MLPGQPPYLPNLIQSLTQDTGVAFPSSVFTSLLLCMVAGNSKHLILRTRDEDVEELKALVVRILVTIFGLPTQRIALKPGDTVADFLSDIFLVPPQPSFPSPRGQGPPSSPMSHRPRSGRMGSTPSHRARSQKRKARIERSESGSSVGMNVAAGENVLLGHGRTTSSTSNMTNGTATTQRPRKKSFASSATVNTITTNSHSNSSPHTSFPSPIHRRSRILGSLTVPGMSDDAASMRPLRPQSTHGLHIETNPPTPTTPLVNLPSLASPGEYPPTLHHSQSATPPSHPASAHIGLGLGPINLTPFTPRLPHALVLSKLEKAKVSVQNALADVLRSSRVAPDDYTQADVWDDEEDDQDELTYGGGTWNLPSGFVVVYVCGLGDGREKLGVERSLLDRFSFNGRIKLEPDLYNSSPGPFRRTALISREDVERLQDYCTNVHISPRLQNYVCSLITATRCQPQLEATLLTARCVADYNDLIRASRVVLGRYEDSDSDSMSATDADARKMLVNVLEHRLSVRKGPSEEVMGSLYGAAGAGADGGKARGDQEEYAADDEGEGRKRRPSAGELEVDRETVESILHTILDDV